MSHDAVLDLFNDSLDKELESESKPESISESISESKLESFDTTTNPFSLQPEIYDGNTEYKLLIKADKKRQIGLATQMGFRLREGNGQAIYWLGIMDNGYALGTTKAIIDTSLHILSDIAASIGARTKILSLTNIGNDVQNLGIDLSIPFYQSIIGYTPSEEEDLTVIPPDRYIASIEILSYKSMVGYETITVGVMGNVNAGKSTLIGTMVTGENDDGQGKNRTHVFNHIHELETKRTSSISHLIFGFQPDGNIKYYDPGIDWGIITKESDKIIKFFDLAGHEKYLKTTIKGLTHHRPNYVIITIEATKTITDITKNHITLCRLHKIPFIILLTKIDMANRHVYCQTTNALGTLLKTHFQMIPNYICDIDDAIRTSEQLYQQQAKIQTDTKGQVTTSSLVPIIGISCVSGEGLDLLKMMLYRLKSNRKYDSCQQVEFYLENIFDNVTGIGLVVSGLLTSGTVKRGQQLNLGPDMIGNYQPIKIKSIHVDKQPVDKVTAGQHCSFAITNKKKDELKKFSQKDMVILDDLVKPMAYTRIKINLKMPNIQKILVAKLKKITLGISSCFMLQFNNNRRAGIIVKIHRINKQIFPKPITMLTENKDDYRISTGDNACVEIELINPAYIKKRDMCILTESHMFGMAIVDEIIN